ncbi:hypothetical protein D9M71_123510 [compost metagenome]
MHQIGLPGHPDHRVRADPAGFDDAETLPLVEAMGTGIDGVVDQAQAIRAFDTLGDPGFFLSPCAS